MAKSQSRGGEPGTKGPSSATGWAALTWDDLERWAGSGSVTRGRSYQRGGRVRDLRISGDGALLATVVGGERYATTVELGPGRKRRSLESACTCPVGAGGCKHAVAVVAEYLQAVADGRGVPVATDDDPRWAAIESADVEGDGWDEDDESWDDEDAPPAGKPRGPKRSARRGSAAAEWDDKIERHIRAKPHGELAALVWSLARRFPEVYQEFRERIALHEGDVKQLVAETRREIRQVTSEADWEDDGSDEGQATDYSRIRRRLERLLELGHADEVVSLGRELIPRGLRQAAESHDGGGMVRGFLGCLSVVFQAVVRSSLSGPERLLFAIDAELDDGYDLISDASAPLLDAAQPADWSAVADTLAKRLKTASPEESRGHDDFTRNYRRDRVTDWIATALHEAGREPELGAIFEAEARATGSYERLVAFLLEKRRFEDAERWAREGIAATCAKSPGIAKQLAARLCELARKRKQWDVVAAHAAREFFEHPGPSGFEALVQAARKAGLEEPVRAAALRFLETGTAPVQFVSPRPAAPTAPPKGRSVSTRTAASSPEPPRPRPDRLKVDPAWPLPVPEYLVPLWRRPGPYDPAPRPHLEVLLEMAIAAKRPDEVLQWFDRMRSEPQPLGYYNRASTYADRVAAAVSAVYPERAIAIYRATLDAQLPHAQPAAYEVAADCLRKLRPLYAALDRAGEWTALLASIREKYRNRPRFMELLDGLEGRTIVQSTRTRR